VAGLALGGRERRRWIGDVEASAILIAVLVALSVLIGPLAVAVATAAFGGGWAVRRRLTVRRPTVVIGPPDFCRRVLDAAGAHRKWCDVRPVTTPEDLLGAAPPGGRPADVIVDGALLDQLPDAAVAMIDARRRLRVLPSGASPGAAFEEPLDFPETCVKRALDVVLAVLLIVLTAPAIVLSALAILVESGRPVFFVQTRLGKGGQPFRLIKLRTMVSGGQEEQQRYLQAMTVGAAAPQGVVYKPLDLARVTRVGALLRRFSLDEVPQLSNVLGGHMSIVGPRPPMVHEAQVYDDRSWQRLRVKPGLTGLAQINGRSALPLTEIVAFDTEYATRWSPTMELAILAKTPLVVLLARGAR